MRCGFSLSKRVETRTLLEHDYIDGVPYRSLILAVPVHVALMI